MTGWKGTFRNWRYRVAFNFFPCYRRTGARIERLSVEDREAIIRLPLRWTTRGYFGTTFGGSMYGAVDPVYMVMLNILLGDDYAVWDKSASIDFLRQGRGTLYARFHIETEELEEIRQLLDETSQIDRTYQVELADAEGVVCARATKIVNIRRKSAHARISGGGESK